MMKRHVSLVFQHTLGIYFTGSFAVVLFRFVFHFLAYVFLTQKYWYNKRWAH